MLRRMKKLISYVGLLLVSASVLVGCNKAEDTTSSPPATTSTNRAPATT